MKLTNRYRYRGIHRKWNDQLTELEECRGREVRERKKRKLSAQFAERVLRWGGGKVRGRGRSARKDAADTFSCIEKSGKKRGWGEGWVGGENRLSRRRHRWWPRGTRGWERDKEGITLFTMPRTWRRRPWIRFRGDSRHHPAKERREEGKEGAKNAAEVIK